MDKIMKLTPAQAHAMTALTDEWIGLVLLNSRYGITAKTLEALVRKGLAEEDEDILPPYLAYRRKQKLVLSYD